MATPSALLRAQWLSPSYTGIKKDTRAMAGMLEVISCQEISRCGRVSESHWQSLILAYPNLTLHARYMIAPQLLVEEFFFAPNAAVEQRMKGGRVVVMAGVAELVEDDKLA